MMRYIDKARAQIELAALTQPAHVPNDDRELATEIANAIMDGCAEELAGCDVRLLDAETRIRMQCVLAALKGTVLSR